MLTCHVLVSASTKPDDSPATAPKSAPPDVHNTHRDADSRQSSNAGITPGRYHHRNSSRQERPAAEQAIDPELTKRDPSNDPGYNEAIKAWGRFRFVRAGWFTAQEAIDYID